MERCELCTFCVVEGDGFKIWPKCRNKDSDMYDKPVKPKGVCEEFYPAGGKDIRRQL